MYQDTEVAEANDGAIEKETEFMKRKKKALYGTVTVFQNVESRSLLDESYDDDEDDDD